MRRDTRLRRTLAAVDVVAAIGALLVTVAFERATLKPAGVVAVALLILLADKTVGLYDQDEYRVRKSTLDEAPALAAIAIVYALLVWFAERVVVDGTLHRLQVFMLATLAFAALSVGRTAVRALVRSVTPPERCIVLGSASSAARVAAKVHGSPSVSAQVLGWVDLGRPVAHTAHGVDEAGTLLAAPLYVVGKVPLYFAFLVRPQRAWVRTPRNAPQPPGEVAQ